MSPASQVTILSVAQELNLPTSDWDRRIHLTEAFSLDVCQIPDGWTILTLWLNDPRTPTYGFRLKDCGLVPLRRLSNYIKELLAEINNTCLEDLIWKSPDIKPLSNRDYYFFARMAHSKEEFFPVLWKYLVLSRNTLDLIEWKRAVLVGRRHGYTPDEIIETFEEMIRRIARGLKIERNLA